MVMAHINFSRQKIYIFVNTYTSVKTVVVSVRLPEEIVLELKKRKKNISEAIRDIIIKEIKKEKEEKEKILKELEKLEVIKERKTNISVVELIREDRDVLH